MNDPPYEEHHYIYYGSKTCKIKSKVRITTNNNKEEE